VSGKCKAPRDLYIEVISAVCTDNLLDREFCLVEARHASDGVSDSSPVRRSVALFNPRLFVFGLNSRVFISVCENADIIIVRRHSCVVC
jgi:hypothetical protein